MEYFGFIYDPPVLAQFPEIVLDDQSAVHPEAGEVIFLDSAATFCWGHGDRCCA